MRLGTQRTDKDAGTLGSNFWRGSRRGQREIVVEGVGWEGAVTTGKGG